MQFMMLMIPNGYRDNKAERRLCARPEENGTDGPLQ